MNAYLRKEIRLLLPSFGIALMLAFSVWLIPTEPTQGKNLWVWLIVLPLLLCPALVVMTSLDSFGREISSNTFANLLAQPVSRSRIWWTKTLLLAAALLVVFGVWWLAYLLHTPAQLKWELTDLQASFSTTVLLLLTAYSGGLLWVLLLRQVGAAFWFTLIVPSALAMLTVYLTGKFGGAIYTERNVGIVLVTYSVVGFLWARWMFLRAQDVHWTGGNIALPAWVKLPRWFIPSVRIAGRRPRLALIVKELQLHQSQFVIAGVLAILHLTIIVVRNAYGGLKESWTLEFMGFQFWTLWLVMPLLIGCAAVAEERKLGTLEAQLCLPARRRTQLVIKFAVALALAIFFGVAVPVLFEGDRILPDFSANLASANNAHNGFLAYGIIAGLIFELLTELTPVLLILPQLLVAVFFVVISFYASTLARNTLQAIAPAILGILVVWALWMGARLVEAAVGYPLWRGWLIYFIGFPVLAATLAWLTYWNFKRVLVGWPVWRRNLTTFLTAFACVVTLTTALYHRAWELLLRLEPEHGPERISHMQFPLMQVEGGSWMTVVFPDGKLWKGIFMFHALPGNDLNQSLFDSQFLSGSNWVNIVAVQGENVAIKSDGSLWLAETPQIAVVRTNNKPVIRITEAARLTRIGSETNWQRVIREAWSPAVLLLKTDGTLWEWGTNQFDFKQKWPRLSSSAIRRLGSESDWADMASAGSSIYLWNQDRHAWAINPYFQGPKKKRVELSPGVQMERYPQFDDTRWRNLASGQPFQVGVRDDGTLWGGGLMGRVFEDPHMSSGQIGTETNWVSVVCAHTTMVALKADGALWKWDLSFRSEPDRNAAPPIRLGEQNDWVAVAGWWNGVVSLAADGSLWHWQLGPSPSYSLGFNFPPLLGTSRRPELIGNIFSEAK